MHEVYQITNLVNGKKYIGQCSFGYIKRWCNHKSASRLGIENKICRAIRKYGEENFLVELIATVDKTTADRLEKYLIAAFETTVNGYNIKLGGEGSPLPEETKQKISRTNKQRFIDNPELRGNVGARKRGIKYPPEFGIKISKANKGRIMTEAQKAKLSLSLKAHWSAKKDSNG